MSKELEDFIDETIRLGAEKGYHPTVFIKMRRDHTTIPAISKLVQNGDIQSGFRRLEKLGLLDATIEAAVLKFPTEFPEQVIACAEFRLRVARNNEKL